MAGLWDRIEPNAEDRVPIHLIVAGIRAYFVNGVDNTKGATSAQILTAINNQIETDLDGAAQTDLSAIATEIDSLSNNTQKLIYLQNIEYVFTAAEFGVIGETKFRGDLGI